MLPHGSFFLDIREVLGEEINTADLQKITRDDIRRWRGLYNMAGASDVSSDTWVELKARAKELGIDWDHYTPICVGDTIEEPDSEESNNGEVSKMVKTGDVIVGESYEDETGNNAVASSSEFVEEDGQLIKRAKGVGFSGSGDDVYDVTVTFKTVIRVRADYAEDAISDAEEKMEEALDDGDVSFESFEYRVKK